MAPQGKDMRRPDLSEPPPARAALALNQEHGATQRGVVIWKKIGRKQPQADSIAVVPYQEPEAKSENADISSTMSSTLPMAAMFTRNKFVGWASVVFSIQNWLGESEDAKKNASTPGYFSIGMSVAALGIVYMPLFLPPQAGGKAAGTGPAPPMPAS